MANVIRDQFDRPFGIARTAWANAFDLERLLPALEFAIALRVVRVGLHIGQAAEADQRLEVIRDNQGVLHTRGNYSPVRRRALSRSVLVQQFSRQSADGVEMF